MPNAVGGLDFFSRAARAAAPGDAEGGGSEVDSDGSIKKVSVFRDELRPLVSSRKSVCFNLVAERKNAVELDKVMAEKAFARDARLAPTTSLRSILSLRRAPLGSSQGLPDDDGVEVGRQQAPSEAEAISGELPCEGLVLSVSGAPGPLQREDRTVSETEMESTGATQDAQDAGPPHETAAAEPASESNSAGDRGFVDGRPVAGPPISCLRPNSFSPLRPSSFSCLGPSGDRPGQPRALVRPAVSGPHFSQRLWGVRSWDEELAGECWSPPWHSFRRFHRMLCTVEGVSAEICCGLVTCNVSRTGAGCLAFAATFLPAVLLLTLVLAEIFLVFLELSVSCHVAVFAALGLTSLGAIVLRGAVLEAIAREYACGLVEAEAVLFLLCGCKINETLALHVDRAHGFLDPQQFDLGFTSSNNNSCSLEEKPSSSEVMLL